MFLGRIEGRKTLCGWTIATHHPEHRAVDEVHWDIGQELPVPGQYSYCSTWSTLLHWCCRKLGRELCWAGRAGLDWTSFSCVEGCWSNPSLGSKSARASLAAGGQRQQIAIV